MVLYNLLKEYFLRYKYLFLVGIFLNIINALIFIIPPILGAVFINLIFSQGDVSQQTLISKIVVFFTQENQSSTILFFILFAVMLMFLYVLTSYIKDTIVGVGCIKISQQLREKLFRKMLYLPISYFKNNPSGEIVTRIMRDVYELQKFLSGTFVTFFYNIILLIGILIFVFYLSPLLTLYTLIGAPIILGFINIIGKNIKKLTNKILSKADDINSFLFQKISGIDIIKLFTAEKHEDHKFQEISETYYRYDKNSFLVSSLTKPTIEFIGSLAIITILTLGAIMITNGELKNDELVAYVLSLLNLSSPINGITTFNVVFQAATVSAKRIKDILDLDSENYKSFNEDKEKLTLGKIEFKNVYFQYNVDSKVILEDISFTIEPKEVVAIIGKTGCGKTTLASLIPRLYDINKGSILINSVDIKNIPLYKLRDGISVVPQDSYLFPVTIEENILYGNPNINLDEFNKAVRIAFVDEIIEKLPDGIKTLVGERGGKLSTGQRQRIALARAIIKKPSIMILDEATSALDNESEQYIQTALNAIIHNQTTIIIAHRLSTIRNVDKIIVMDEGKIVDYGSHTELLSRLPYYEKLYNLQFL